MTRYFKGLDGTLYVVESETARLMLPEGCVEQDSTEHDALVASQSAQRTQTSADLWLQIDRMERMEQLPRVTSESTMAFAVMLAASQGVSEAELYATNIAYRKIKDFDVAIAALRDQAAAL